MTRTSAAPTSAASFRTVGIELDGDGAHPAAWRSATHAPADLLAPSRLAAQVRAVEAAGFGFVSLVAERPGDGHPNVQARLDPVETASFLAAHTSHVGLLVETPVVGAEPFHLANRLASLDWAAQGRAGWAPSDATGERAEVRDVVEAVRTLWDTWEDGVLLADDASGRFLDLDRWHYADFRGETFFVKGPSITPRPPQGNLPVVGTHPVVDVVRVGGADVADAVARARAARAGGARRVLLDVEVLLDADVPAAARLAALGPWPSSSALRLVGSPVRVLDALTAVAGHVDAVRLDPAVLDVDLPVLVDRVLPALRQSASPGFLRDVLGLVPAVNRFAARRDHDQEAAAR